jgi:hypothetical protein
MKLIAKDCRGLFARGTVDTCPPGFITEATNIYSKGPNLVTRPAIIKFAGNNKDNVTHLSIFNPLPVAGVLSPKIISHQSAGPKSIWNTADFPGAAIYFPAVAYHSWINFFGRGYFTLHDTLIASPTDNVQVYEGGAASRNAAGSKPVSAMAGAAAVGGNLGVGKYLVDVAYVTASGFKTKRSGSVLAKDCFGSYKIDLTVIPTSGTNNRQIVATKAIPLGTYTGNPNDYEFFEVPNGLLNSTDTTFTVSFFDGDLSVSADALENQLETIPSGMGIGEYNGRMLVWGERNNPSIVRFSAPGSPESFDAISGLIVIDPTESGGVTNCIVLRGTLYIFKANRIYYTIDNGNEPSTWEVKEFDSGVGCEIYGVSKVLDAKGNHMNQFLIATRRGIALFDGLIREKELTFWIEDLWNSLDQSNFSKLQITMNPIHKHIYVIFPTDSTPLFDLLVGDYSNGLDPENIKWFFFRHGNNNGLGNINSLVIGIGANGRPSITVALTATLATIDFDTPGSLDVHPITLLNTIAFFGSIKTPALVFGSEDAIQQINTVGIRQQGGDADDITVQAISAQDSTITSGAATTIPFATAPTKIQDKWIYLPFVDNEPQVRIVIEGTNHPKISRIVIEGDDYGESDPQ